MPGIDSDPKGEGQNHFILLAIVGLIIFALLNGMTFF